MMKTVFDHTSGLAASTASRRAVSDSPYAGLAAGCSLMMYGGTSQDTCGSVPCCTSFSKAAIRYSPREVSLLAAVEPATQARPRLYSSDAVSSLRKFLNHGSELSP